jgi:mono/diheme cytochrome c family protein
MNIVKTLASTLALAALALALPAQAETPAALLAGYSAAAKATADPARGQQFFTSTHGREWSCSSCHGALPVKEGKHAATGKLIQPMAPAFNAERFTDGAKTEKWFRRNCNDVVGRECTPGEKADLIAWLLTLKA